MTISKQAVKTLNELWSGQYLIIHLKGVNLIVADPEQGNISVAPMIEGFCYEVDSSYFYLGLNEVSGITKTLPHESVALVELMSASIDEEFMNEMPVGEDVH